MTSQRRRFIAYLATVFAVTLVLFFCTSMAPAIAFLVAGVPVYLSLTLFYGQVPPAVMPFLGFTMVFLFLAVLALPTLGALTSRRENAFLWLVVQFVMLIVHFVINAWFISRPH